MAFLIKLALGFLVVAITGGFLVNKVPSWKEKIVEIINPATKEARLLGELMASLDELDTNLDDGESKDLLNKSRGILQNITDLNQENSGIIKQQIGRIIDALIDRTPYPADHLTPITDESGQLVCPPVE